jgi:hypothetical protein
VTAALAVAARLPAASSIFTVTEGRLVPVKMLAGSDAKASWPVMAGINPVKFAAVRLPSVAWSVYVPVCGNSALLSTATPLTACMLTLVALLAKVPEDRVKVTVELSPATRWPEESSTKTATGGVVVPVFDTDCGANASLVAGSVMAKPVEMALARPVLVAVST